MLECCGDFFDDEVFFGYQRVMVTVRFKEKYSENRNLKHR
jgi:hypothetical protein